MAWRRCATWAALVVLAVSSGCCRLCERWCGHPTSNYPAPAASHYAAPAQVCTPVCIPVCCQPAAQPNPGWVAPNRPVAVQPNNYPQ